jgi:hypothetical protein
MVIKSHGQRFTPDGCHCPGVFGASVSKHIIEAFLIFMLGYSMASKNWVRKITSPNYFEVGSDWYECGKVE